MNNYGTPSIAIRAVKRVNDLKIGWISDNNLVAAQTRIRIINIHRRLRSIGWDSRIVTPQIVLKDNFDFVVVGKEFSKSIYDTILQLKERDTFVICDLCEDLFDLHTPYYEDIIRLSHCVVCSSDRLTSKVQKINYSAYTIEDAVETNINYNCQYIPREKLKAIFIGYGGSSRHLKDIRPVLEKNNIDLVEIHEWDTATIKWDRTTWYKHALNCDIAIVPIPVINPEECKSNNRVTQLQALGLPVIAGRLPAYNALINHKKTGYFANGEVEWNIALEALKDASHRKEIGLAGKQIAKNYLIPNMADKWISLFNSYLNYCDIIIPSYNNTKYLKHTLNAIKLTTKHPYRVTVIDSSTIELDGDLTADYYNFKHYDNRLNYSVANNKGLEVTKGTYVCFLNNDIVPSKDWLSTLIKSPYDITGPLSNCDFGWTHNHKITVDNKQLVPNMVIEDFDSRLIYDIKGVNEYYPRTWVAFYCVVTTRKLINQVGILDPNCRNNAEDLDYCIRATKHGLKIGQDYRAFVFHYGGKTRKVSEIEDSVQHSLDDRFSSSYISSKYKKKTVVIWQWRSWKQWDDQNVELGGIGGSELWTIYLSREFKKLGYSVKVFNDCPNSYKDFDGIEYRHWTSFSDWNNYNYADYFISSRSLEPFKLPMLRAKEKYVMVHDIWLMLNDPADIAYKDKVDKYFCLSKAHKQFFSNHHKINDKNVLITSNGIDFSRFDNIDEAKRNKYKIIYSSSPDRGLDNLLNMWPVIKKEIPEAELHVYYGFDFFPENKKQYVDRTLKRMKDLGVFYHGNINQAELAKEMKTARVLAYPSWFEETFCITAIEAMASGCVFIGSGYWGLQDTVKDAGILFAINNRMDCTKEVYHKQFINELVKLIKDDEYFLSWQRKGFERVKRYDWASVASQWNQYFENKIWELIQ